MTVWHVWTDGSCQYATTVARPFPRGTSGAGGWCAIIEHGSDGEVHRGRAAATTNVRMELVAATEGLRATPTGAEVVLHTDCTTILCVRDALERDERRLRRGPDREFWQALAVEIRRRRVSVRLLGKGVRDEVHRRAHGFAGAEARAQLADLPENAVPIDQEHRRAARARRRALADQAETRKLAVEQAEWEARGRENRARARRVWQEGMR